MCKFPDNSTFDPQEKWDLVLGEEILVGKYRGKMFLVVGNQVCTHIGRDFGPLVNVTIYNIYVMCFCLNF